MTGFVRIRNATVAGDEVTVFERLSLLLDRGENTVILGPNGAGKSTLLKLILSRPFG
jgi:ABC-type Mn2+/Zn2+ transport system ATPase subunit